MMPSRQTFALPPDTVPSDWEPQWESWWPTYQPPTEAPTANLPPGAAKLIRSIPDDLAIPEFLKRRETPAEAEPVAQPEPARVEATS
jgi:hypothetical protein